MLPESDVLGTATELPINSPSDENEREKLKNQSEEAHLLPQMLPANLRYRTDGIESRNPQIQWKLHRVIAGEATLNRLDSNKYEGSLKGLVAFCTHNGEIIKPSGFTAYRIGPTSDSSAKTDNSSVSNGTELRAFTSPPGCVAHRQHRSNRESD